MPIQPNAPSTSDIIAARGQDIHEEFTLYDDPNKQTPTNLTGKTPAGTLTGLGVAGVVYSMPVTIKNMPGTDGVVQYDSPRADTSDATVTPDIGDFKIWINSTAQNIPLIIGRQRLR
jgi:hypothetical protein